MARKAVSLVVALYFCIGTVPSYAYTDFQAFGEVVKGIESGENAFYKTQSTVIHYEQKDDRESKGPRHGILGCLSACSGTVNYFLSCSIVACACTASGEVGSTLTT